MKMIIVFGDIIAETRSNKNINLAVTELFISGRKLKMSLVFVAPPHFSVPKNIRLNSTHYFIMKIQNKKELQQVALNDLLDIDFKDFMNRYKNIMQNHIIF